MAEKLVQDKDHKSPLNPYNLDFDVWCKDLGLNASNKESRHFRFHQA